MTERELNEITRLLNQDTHPNASPELDRTILAAAEQYTHKQQIKRSFLSRNAWVPAMSLALVMTVGLLVGMSAWVAPTAPEAPLTGQTLPINVSTPTQTQSSDDVDRTVATLSEPPLLNHSAQSDDVLTSYPLPDTETVLAAMQFDLQSQREAASEQVQLALHDMSQFIQRGALHDARQRYQRLRETCLSCELPSTLELLLLASREPLDQRRSADTG
ncbi:hypothetical protein GCM10008090_11110 [Arenicella chitinivorans]|uniref:Uncharacterized protein n=1 Tax=Arenicella chitinivorans TaxID=1329800 RepID=A0A918RP18_9GAMM|nr:hypothetical protein [Arenicella chitinivorans]GHA03712.1 hypothetical protein GCM10008090_11110 [Arenicella chitinivorans]